MSARRSRARLPLTQAALPARDHQRGGVRREGRELPLAPQRDQASSDPGAEATARRAARRSTPIPRLSPNPPT